MTSLQNLDCEAQSVYFPQLPWCLDCGVEILLWLLSCGTLRTRPQCPLPPTKLNSLKGSQHPGAGKERGEIE